LKLAKANLEIANKDIQIAKGAFQPSLSVSYGLNSNISYNKVPFLNSGTGQIDYNRASPFFQQFEENFGQNIGISLNIPIFNGFATRNNVQRNKVNYEKVKLNVSQQELDIERNVFTAYTDTKAAKESYEAALQIEKARELAMQYAKDRYEIGMMNVFDYNQSQTAFVNAQSEVLRTKYDYIFRIKILEFYFGIPLIEKQ
jgi:outer membrane protein